MSADPWEAEAGEPPEGPGRASTAQRIIARAAGVPHVAPGDIVWAAIDLALLHDSAGPRRIGAALQRFGGRVWDADRVVVVIDHFAPPGTEAASAIVDLTRAWAREQGIHRFHEATGISHTLVVENAYAHPGDLYLGGDSHTCTAGALGCLALGAGSTDMLAALVTGETWLVVPPTLAIELDGDLARGVTAKDVMLSCAARSDAGIALGSVIEFWGAGIAALDIEQRCVLTNMTAELGAATGIIAADAKTLAHVERHAGTPRHTADARATDLRASRIDDYVTAWRLDASTLSPMIARPGSVATSVPAEQLGDERITHAYLGSCTGAQYSDLAMAAEVLGGRRVAPGVQLRIAPASDATWRRAARDGTLTTLIEAGAHFVATGCGACIGYSNGILGREDICISSTSRNYRGRMGAETAQIYLGSPFSVAAAAVAGRIVDAREFLGDATAC